MFSLDTAIRKPIRELAALLGVVRQHGLLDATQAIRSERHTGVPDPRPAIPIDTASQSARGGACRRRRSTRSISSGSSDSNAIAPSGSRIS